MDNTVLSLKNVNKTYIRRGEGALKVLEDISLEIKENEIFIFLGPSGCGKSTLLRIMAELDKSYEGEILYSPAVNPKTDINFVFQEFALLPWLTVAENVEIGLIARGMKPWERHELVLRELQTLGLEKFANSHPKALSGGMKQRVGIARALITNPKVLFMDEAFSELDSFTAEELRKEILNIWKERNFTIIMVTHIIEEALELADRIAVLAPRPGKIEAVIENDLPRPREKRTQSFYDLEDKIYKLIKP